MNKLSKKLLAAVLCLIMVISAFPAAAGASSYTYSIWDEAIPSPDAYEWEASIRGKNIGLEDFKGLSDIFFQNGFLYIAVTGAVIVTDADFNFQYSITEYETDSGTVKISSPTGLFVTEGGDLYVCEEAKGEIVQFDPEHNWVRTLTDPGITGLESIKFAPTKVVVDANDRIFVKAKSVYEGIIELTPEGEYSRFVGANKVSPSLTERFYRMIATDEQISRMTLWLPTDFSDIAIDQDGFLMATVRDRNSENPVRKLNSGGSDIMPEYDTIPSAMGDYVGGISNSSLTDITTSEDGRFAVLDSQMNRIFVYSNSALLVYTFGGSGKKEGSLNSPVGMCFMEDKILVADLVARSIEVFTPTPYGALINEALRYQGEYDYETAASYWEQVYDINPGLVASSMGLGKQALRDGNFESAMEHFKACGEREEYSSAYERIREDFLSRNFLRIILIVLAVIVGLVLLGKLFKKLNTFEGYRSNPVVKALKKIRYTVFTWPWYMMTSPFKAFDDVKYENAGSTVFAVIILILYSWANLIKIKYAGFLVNYANTAKINVLLTLVSCLLPFVLFILGNWAVGTLINGKGNMKQVLKVTAYSLYPTVFLYVIGVIVSQGIIFEERMFVQFLFYFPMVMFAFYCFIGLIMVHQFTFTKGIGSVLLSAVAIVILIFVIVLLVTLVSGFINDLFTIWDEIALYYL